MDISVNSFTKRRPARPQTMVKPPTNSGGKLEIIPESNYIIAIVLRKPEKVKIAKATTMGREVSSAFARSFVIKSVASRFVASFPPMFALRMESSNGR